MERVSKIYQYPGHANRLFDRVVREFDARGFSLHSLNKGYFLGTGMTLRFEFEDAPASEDYKMVHYYGRRRPDSDKAFDGWNVFKVLPMRAWWVTIGYFYALKRLRQSELPYQALEATADPLSS